MSGRPAIIALVIHGAGWAGTERHVRGLLEALPEAGAEVHLIASEEGPLLEEARRYHVTPHVITRSKIASYMTNLKHLLREIQPDVVHAHSGRLPGLAARWAGVPAVVETRHGLPERRRALYRALPLLRAWEAWKCALAHRTIAVCEADARWLRAAGLPGRRVRLVPNGIGPAECAPLSDRGSVRRRWGLPEHAKLIGLVGRLSPEKAPGRFLEVLRFLLSADVGPGGTDPGRLTGVICGAGPEEPRLRRLATELSVGERVVWLGTRPVAGELVGALDLLLLPSLVEGCPYVLLEALAAGVPVLCAPVGGIPELMTGPVLSASCLRWDAGTWGRRAAVLLESESARREWSRAARARAAEFPEARTVGGVIAVYRELLGL